MNYIVVSALPSPQDCAVCMNRRGYSLEVSSLRRQGGGLLSGGEQPQKSTPSLYKVPPHYYVNKFSLLISLAYYYWCTNYGIKLCNLEF